MISVVIEEFVDRFHHGKEEQAYFIVIKHKDGLLEDIRKFLVEDELEKRIATLLLRELKARTEENTSREPVVRFLKSYSVFFTDHTLQEDIFINRVEEKGSISSEDNERLLKHYEN